MFVHNDIVSFLLDLFPGSFYFGGRCYRRLQLYFLPTEQHLLDPCIRFHYAFSAPYMHIDYELVNGRLIPFSPKCCELK